MLFVLSSVKVVGKRFKPSPSPPLSGISHFFLVSEKPIRYYAAHRIEAMTLKIRTRDKIEFIFAIVVDYGV